MGTEQQHYWGGWNYFYQHNAGVNGAGFHIHCVLGKVEPVPFIHCTSVSCLCVTYSAFEHDWLLEALLTDRTRVTALQHLLLGGRGPIRLYIKIHTIFEVPRLCI